MCGIFGYVGKREAAPILVDGLTSLEYRGYDSAGIFVPNNSCVRAVGAVDNLRKKMPDAMPGQSGIAHLRWATHGEPSELNAHPHTDCGGMYYVVHNGIIENFSSLKKGLAERGHTLVSETDTEVIAHLVEEAAQGGAGLEEAAMQAIKQLEGTYGLLISSNKEPGKIIVGRRGAPIVLGIGEGERFVASDASPILRHTKEVVYLRDGDIAVLEAHGHSVHTAEGLVERAQEKITWDAEQIQKGGFPHFMLKEIMEEPDVIENALRGRVLPQQGLVKLGGLEAHAERLRQAKRVVLVGCGTAFYAAQVGKYLLEEYVGIPVDVEVGSEFRYRKPIIDEDTVVVVVSQSGETADTLEAVREGKRRGALTLGIVNVVGSTIAREVDGGIYNHAGPEIGVASTKAFVSQLTVLVLLAVFLGRQRSLSHSSAQEVLTELVALPEKLRAILTLSPVIEDLAKKYAGVRDCLFIGRKYSYPIAYEGALKLKEISYMHAEGYGAGEMKHGPLALIDENMPTVAIMPKDSVFEKTLSNVQEIRARKGKVIGIMTEGSTEGVSLCDDIVMLPKTLESLTPILSVIPLQLFAYYVSVVRGNNVDRPRNLAKSVTVE